MRRDGRRLRSAILISDSSPGGETWGRRKIEVRILDDHGVSGATGYDADSATDPAANPSPDANPANTVPAGWTKVNDSAAAGTPWDHPGAPAGKPKSNRYDRIRAWRWIVKPYCVGREVSRRRPKRIERKIRGVIPNPADSLDLAMPLIDFAQAESCADDITRSRRDAEKDKVREVWNRLRAKCPR